MAAEKKQIPVSVNKESSEVFEAADGLLGAIIEKSAGGLTLAEIIEAVTADIGKLTAAVTGIEKVAAEFQDSAEDSLMPAFIMAQNLAKKIRGLKAV